MNVNQKSDSDLKLNNLSAETLPLPLGHIGNRASYRSGRAKTRISPASDRRPELRPRTGNPGRAMTGKGDNDTSAMTAGRVKGPVKSR